MIPYKGLTDVRINKVYSTTTKASGVSKRVLRARNAVTVTQRACLLMEHGNWLKAEKQHGVKVNGDNRQNGRKEKNEMESTSSVMTLMYWWHSLSFGRTMTNKENHSSCQPALRSWREKTLEAPFSQKCLLDKIMWINRKQMFMFSVLLQFHIHNLQWHTELKHKQEEEIEY